MSKVIQAKNIEGKKNFQENKKTVLVVEDDRSHRIVMDKILKECQFDTVQAENGLIALSKIDTGQHFDLIIMDWDMPEMDGLETVRQIRAREINEGRERKPVIAFTSNREPGDRELCLAAGMDGYLPKDVWMPKWRNSLIDNLQGLIVGNYEMNDFNDEDDVQSEDITKSDFDLDAFDFEMFNQAAELLKDELEIAVDEYLEDAAAYIRDICAGVESGDADVSARGSHPLKSNSKNFGLTSVSEIAEAINAEALKGNLERVQSLLPKLEDAFKRAEKKLRGVTKQKRY